MFRQIDGIIEENDIFLADRAFAGWFEMARMMERGAHIVIRKHQRRKSDFRTGIRYGKHDHGIQIDKPGRPQWRSEEEYEAYPDFILIREIKIRVSNKGFRTREIIVHTSSIHRSGMTPTTRRKTSPRYFAGGGKRSFICEA